MYDLSRCFTALTGFVAIFVLVLNLSGYVAVFAFLAAMFVHVLNVTSKLEANAAVSAVEAVIVGYRSGNLTALVTGRIACIIVI